MPKPTRKWKSAYRKAVQLRRKYGTTTVAEARQLEAKSARANSARRPSVDRLIAHGVSQRFKESYEDRQTFSGPEGQPMDAKELAAYNVGFTQGAQSKEKQLRDELERQELRHLRDLKQIFMGLLAGSHRA